MPDVLGGLLRPSESTLRRVLLAPARAMAAQPPATPTSLGLLGRIHEAIDPIRAFGGYGGAAAMALPPGAPRGLLGKAALDAENAAISQTRRNSAVPGELEGAAPDRSHYSLVRHKAPRGDSARFARLEEKITTNPKAAELLRKTARDGEEVGRKWYNTEELRTRFQSVLGEQAGDDAWREYMWLVGATSPGSKVMANIKNASHYFVQRKKLQGLADELIAGDVMPPSGYGHKAQILQAKNVGNILKGEWGPDAPSTLNPKPRGFLQSLLGNRRNIAADSHFMRLMGMISDDPAFLHTSAEISKGFADKLRARYGNTIDPYISVNEIKDTGKMRINFNAKRAVAKGPPGLFKFIKKNQSVWDALPKANEYDAFERIAGGLAREMNMTPAQFQASLWIGGARKTGVAPSSLDTFVNLFDTRVREAASKRGRTPEDVFRRFATRKEALALPLGLLSGGTAGGLLNQQD